MYSSLFRTLDDHKKEYETGTLTISENIEFSMYQRVRTTTHQILSRYMDGTNKDPLTGRRRPYRNIGNAIVDLESRAKNIDRKSIEAHAVDEDHIFALIVNKEVQQWMKDNNFGKTIDAYQRKKSEHGSVLMKKTEVDGTLLIEPVQWENMIVDPLDITNGIKIEKNNLSILELMKKRDVWTEECEGELAIDLVIEAAKKLKGSDRRVEVWDIEGEFEASAFTEDDEDTDIGLYNAIVALVRGKKYLLYYKKLTKSRFKHFKRKEVEGRDMGMGVWEEVTEPQIWTNDAVIAEHDVMSVAGKVVIKTNKKGLPSAMMMVNGETLDMEPDEYFEAVQLTPTSLPEFQNQIDSWFVNMQRDQSAYPGMTGEEPKASTPAASLQLQAAQGASIFNQRRDQDGYDITEMLNDWVLPFVVKDINDDHTLTAAYSSKELKRLDQAIKNLKGGEKKKGMVIGNGEVITAEDDALIDMQLQEELDTMGAHRSLFIPKGYITLDKIRTKVRFDITDEMKDDQRQLNALSVALAQLAPEDPARIGLIQEMMEISGISPATHPIAARPTQAAAPRPLSPSRTESVLPEGQTA